MSPLLTTTSKKPRVILGLMTFGPDEAAGARVTDLAEYNKVLDLLQARGYNEVDTARVYVGGKQEGFTREAKWKERGLTLATKIHFPNELGQNSYDKVIESMDKSLKELGTDCVDLVYLHSAVSIEQFSAFGSNMFRGPDDEHATDLTFLSLLPRTAPLLLQRRFPH